MYVTRHVVAITTAADGSGTGYTPDVNGRVLAISYVKPTTGGYADTVDFDIETELSTVKIWDEDNVTASKAVYPRAATHSTAGAASATDVDHIPVANERIKISVANGGDGGTGTFYVMVG
jgi:hypothetical protein